MESGKKKPPFTSISNYILDELAKCHLASYETSVIFVIFRNTYGRENQKNKRPELTYSYIQKATNIKMSNIATAIKSLKERNLIFVYKSSDYKNIIVFNPKYTEWNYKRNQGTEPMQSETSCTSPTIETASGIRNGADAIGTASGIETEPMHTGTASDIGTASGTEPMQSDILFPILYTPDKNQKIGTF